MMRFSRSFFLNDRTFPQTFSELTFEQTFFKFVKGFCYMMENLIQSQMNDNFNQDILKVIDKIRNKHKQQVNVESIFEQIIKTTGNENISKAVAEAATRGVL